MSLFDNNVVSPLPTETILKYACDIYKDAFKEELQRRHFNEQWENWQSLYNSIINHHPFASDSLYNHFINKGRDRYYEETGHYYIYRFEMYDFEGYIKSNIVKEFYFIETEPLVWDDNLESYIKTCMFN